MATAFVGAGVAIGTKAVKAGAAFETQMNNVSTLLDGDVSKRIIELGDNVKNMSVKTNVSTDLLTEGLYQVISAFGDTADASKILEISALGAKAGNATVIDSVNLLSAVTKGYGDTSAEAASKASDLAFLTVKLGQTTFPELAASMGKVIPLASAMKISQEELFGAMATLTGVTGGTAEVSTQLRATFQSFMKPSSELQAKLEELGFATGAQMLESQGLAKSLDLLKESVNGDETAFANMFSSVEAGTAALALTGSQAENFRSKTEAMNNAIGNTEEAFKKQNKGFDAMIANIKNSVNVAAITLGEKILPGVNNIVESIAGAFATGDWSNVGKVLSEELTNVIKSLVDIIPKMLPVVVDLVNGLADALVKTIPLIAPYVFDAMLMLFNNLLKLLKDNAPALIKVGKELILMLMKGLNDSLPLIIDTAVGIVLSLVDNFIELLPEFIRISIQIIDTLVSGLLEALPSLIDAGINLLFSLIDALIDSMPLLIETAVQIVVALIDGLVQAIPKIIEALPELMSAIWDAIISVDWLKLGGEIIIAIFNGVFKIGKTLVKSVGSFVKGLFGGGDREGAEEMATQERRKRGYATGTSFVPDDGIYRVGEDRPEDVILPRGSQIFPVNGNRSGNNDRTVNINIYDAKVFNENDARKLGQLIGKHWQMAGVGRPV